MIFSFFGKKKEKNPTQSDSTKADQRNTVVKVQYDPKLVNQLKLEHQTLLNTYKEIQDAYKAKDLKKVAAGLGKFRVYLTGHLLKENVRFYIYLEGLLVGDSASISIIRQFRQEMDSIGKAVLDFLDKYRSILDNPLLINSFGTDLEAIGSVLAQRIVNEEETLYPMYMPT